MNSIKLAAVLVAFAAASWFAWHQQSEIARLTGEVATARQALASRIMAEDKKVIEAFELGRERQAGEMRKQKEVQDALEAENRAAAGRLADARERLRRALAAPAGSAGGADVPAAAAEACEPVDAYRARVLEAARNLADGVLEVGADADEVARRHNALIELEPAP